MASRAMLTEKELRCPVCYKIYEDPVVLSCSHSFCNPCLKKWWGKSLLRECPICGTGSPTNNPPSNLVLKNLCEAFLLQERAQGASVVSEKVCSLHSEKLKLFCLDHLQPVCLVCRDSKEHNNHSFRPTHDAAQCCRANILKTLEPLKERLKVLHKDKADRDKTIKHMNVQAKEIEKEIDKNFQKPQKVLQEERKARIWVLRNEKIDNIHMLKENIKSLTRQIQDVSKSISDAEEHLEAPDVSFLQNYKTTVERAKLPLPQEPHWPSGDLIDLTKHLETLKLTSLDQIEHLIKSTMSRSVKYRLSALATDLRKYACKLTLDRNTAYRKLILPEDNRKVTYGMYQSFPDHPERFDCWDQVLCSERLTGRCYWEVDWMGWVSIGVAYRGISRKGEGSDSCLGCNEKSWVLECSDDGYTTRHNDIETPISLQMSPPFSFRSYLHSLWHWRRIVSGRVGVYVDGPAGSLSFYTVSSDTLTHIHTFYCTFTDDLLPAFRVKSLGSVSLCQM